MCSETESTYFPFDIFKFYFISYVKQMPNGSSAFVKINSLHSCYKFDGEYHECIRSVLKKDLETRSSLSIIEFIDFETESI